MPRILPPLPEIGHPEAYYAHKVRRADREGDQHAHEAYKVAQYITLGISPYLTWPEKLKYFRHALARHCNPPPLPDEQLWLFYRNLADLVRRYCGQEALKAISQEDDEYAKRLAAGIDRPVIENEAEQFFRKFVPLDGKCPEWFNHDDFDAIKVFRDQWI